MVSSPFLDLRHHSAAVFSAKPTLLFKVIHTGFEDLLIFFSCYVLIKVFTDTFGVSHLTQDTSVRGSDPFDGHCRSVRVECDIHGRSSVKVHILGSDLSVCSQLFQHFIAGDEPAFSVGYRDGEYVACFHPCKPW